MSKPLYRMFVCGWFGGIIAATAFADYGLWTRLLVIGICALVASEVGRRWATRFIVKDEKDLEHKNIAFQDRIDMRDIQISRIKAENAWLSGELEHANKLIIVFGEDALRRMGEPVSDAKERKG